MFASLSLSSPSLLRKVSDTSATLGDGVDVSIPPGKESLAVLIYKYWNDVYYARTVPSAPTI